MIEFPPIMVGRALHAMPPECTETINFTGPLGSCSGIYYGLCFILGKWGFKTKKVEEYVEVPPGSVFYERTMAEKARLGATINKSLGDIAKVVADYELVRHDLRKYKELMDYFEEEDEHSLKSMFIDRVDAVTKPSLVELARLRWPTIIDDFIKLTDEDVDVGKVAKKLEISRAEAVVLVTKNKLYIEWKEIFKEAIKYRYKRLSELLAAKQKEIEYYRDWLKPYIARYKLIREMYEVPSKIKEAFESFISAAEVAAANKILLWTWTEIVIPEIHRLAIERKAKEFIVEPYDDYIKREFIFNPEGNNGDNLISEFPWITREWVEEKVKEIKGMLDKDTLYYTFIEMEIDRMTLAMPGGKEIEDITFVIKTHAMSQNLLLVKLLELKAKEEEFERYIDQLLGVKKGVEKVEEIVEREYPKVYEVEPKPTPKPYIYKPSVLRRAADQAEKILMFIKKGPYETSFADRVTKMIISQAAGDFGDIRSYLKATAGVP